MIGRFLPSALPSASPAPPPTTAILLPGFRTAPKEDSMAIKHLNQIELADRWNISERTLERWRWTGEGPAYLKIGGRVV